MDKELYIMQKLKVEVEQIVEFLRTPGAGQIIRRPDVGKVTNGFLHPATLANKDSEGTGPDSRVLFGHRVGYPIESLARYMAKKGFFFEQVV
jgi:hypothetical protein